jgi:hypothetical protein
VRFGRADWLEAPSDLESEQGAAAAGGEGSDGIRQKRTLHEGGSHDAGMRWAPLEVLRNRRSGDLCKRSASARKGWAAAWADSTAAGWVWRKPGLPGQVRAGIGWPFMGGYFPEAAQPTLPTGASPASLPPPYDGMANQTPTAPAPPPLGCTGPCCDPAPPCGPAGSAWLLSTPHPKFLFSGNFSPAAPASSLAVENPSRFSPRTVALIQAPWRPPLDCQTTRSTGSSPRLKLGCLAMGLPVTARSR